MRLINKIRRNHALEHATVAVMMQNGIKGLMAGYATSNGFWLVCGANNQQVSNAAGTALKRLYAGENSLAISPHCGTNIAITVLITDIALKLYSRIRRTESTGLGPRILIAAASIAISTPLGLKIQQYFTTLSNMSQVRIRDVNTIRFRSIYLHKVHTRQYNEAN